MRRRRRGRGRGRGGEGELRAGRGGQPQASGVQVEEGVVDDDVEILFMQACQCKRESERDMLYACLWGYFYL
jgi:hypothetical protein